MNEELEFVEKAIISHQPCPKKHGRYINPHIDNIRRRWVDYLIWQSGKYDHENMRPMPPKDFLYPNPAIIFDEQQPAVSWLNHSSFHLQYQGINFYTDPIFSQRCSPFRFFGPKRRHQPPLPLKDLKEVDFVLISHNHYDHLDKPTVLEILKNNPHVTFVVPQGLKQWFFNLGCMHVIELAWWESQEIKISDVLKVRFISVPSQHFSGRGLFDGNKTLWCGFVVQFYEDLELRKQFYFVGDTGYNEQDFKVIGETFGGFDLSLIPIGTYIPYTFMSPVHICPVKSVAIHQEVKSKLSIGMHWKTFKLSDERQMQPPYDLFLAMKEANLDPETFRVLHPGQRINW